jgi:PST family polysaccharide transporter
MTSSEKESSISAPSLTRRTATGVIWGAGGALIYQLLALVVQTALTYILSKAQYGTYAKAFAMLAFAALLQTVGFNEIVLRRGARFRLWRDSVFWFSLLLGVLGALVLAAASLPLAQIYRDPKLTGLLLLTAPLPVIRALMILPTLDLVQAMRFRIYYGLMLANAVGTSLMTLLLARLQAGAASFILGSLLVEPFYVVMLWRFAKSSVQSGPRPPRWLPLAKDLRFVFGSNVARWARSSVDPLILALFATQSVVGVYFFAQSMMNQIFRVITLNLSGVLLPALNRLSDDPKRQTTAFLRAAQVLALVGAPMCVGLGATGTLFVGAFLSSDKWHDLPPLLGVLGGGMVFRLLDEPVQSLISAQGRFRLGFCLSLGASALYVLVCLLGSLKGNALNVTVAVSTYYFMAGPIMLFLAVRRGGATLTDAVRVFLVPLLLSITSILPWVLLTWGLHGHGRVSDMAILAAVMAGAFCTYVLLGRLLQPNGWSELVGRVHDLAPLRYRRAITRIGGCAVVDEPVAMSGS